MGRHLSEMTRILRWRHANLVFALLAILCAGSAMALPGPSGDITGFSSVLVVGAIALLAGHAWGILVIAAAELLIVGKAWPIVTDIITSGDLNSLAGGTALVTTLAALPGLALFVVTLPFMVEVIIGEKDSKAQRPAEVFSCVAATIWLVQPLLPML
jgi:hypothetical protein